MGLNICLFRVQDGVVRELPDAQWDSCRYAGDKELWRVECRRVVKHAAKTLKNRWLTDEEAARAEWAAGAAEIRAQADDLLELLRESADA